ncbi:MAG TPA: bifunctional nuclease family protein [Acidobacteriaceae bacterium]|nr:bifunctional nuclease family protein [Acidobacteriaceae bacterium]
MHLPGFKSEQEIDETLAPEIEVRIRGLMLDPSNRSPIVVLNDLNGEVVLPIWVGLFEANAIALEIEKSTTPRPMTHDLLRNVILGLNARVTRVVVGALRGDTFYATIWLDQSGEVVAIDSRPSDAIALALRSDCPIYVSREVYEHARQAGSNGSVSSEDLRRWLEGLGDDEMGRYKM